MRSPPVVTCQFVQKEWTQRTIEEGLRLPFVFLGYSAFGIFLVLMSSCLVLFWAPAAAGGGVCSLHFTSYRLLVITIRHVTSVSIAMQIDLSTSD